MRRGERRKELQAFQEDDVDLLQTLYEKGTYDPESGISARRGNGLTDAVSHNALNCMKWLLSLSGVEAVPLYTENHLFRNAMDLACQKGLVEFVKLLLEAAGWDVYRPSAVRIREGRDIDLRALRLRDSAVGVAALFGQAECVQAMLDAGVSPNGFPEEMFDGTAGDHDLEYCSALQTIAECSDPACAKLLIEAGADVNKAAYLTGATPLYAAITVGNDMYAMFLLQNGAKAHLVDKEGRAAEDCWNGDSMPLDLRHALQKARDGVGKQTKAAR